MGKWKPNPRLRPRSGRIVQTAERIAEAGAHAEALLGRKVLVKATRRDIVQNVDIIDHLMGPTRERLGCPTDLQTNRLLATIAMQAWNSSRVRGDASAAALAGLREMCRLAPELAPEIWAMLDRARELQPDDRRLLTGVNVEIEGSLLRLRAASIGTP
ncbi:hypothetical protein LBMAG42_03550 [Deltaproteobacteria bacterium]|nr:hypothetical protein LBMAG42_03550 [Deltaproteobacteria bacterium]